MHCAPLHELESYLVNLEVLRMIEVRVRQDLPDEIAHSTRESGNCLCF